MLKKCLIYIIFILAVIATVSSLLSHVYRSSPAWQAEYSYLVPIDDSPENPNAGSGGESPNNWGWLIETARAYLLLAILYFIVGYLHFDQVEETKLTKMLTRVIIILIGVTLFGGLVFHHVQGGPVWLSKHWNAESFTQENYPWLADQDSYWSELIQDDNRLELLSDNKTTAYKKMFLLPYLYYFPYSLVIFMCVLLPVLILTFRGSRQDFASLAIQFNKLTLEMNNDKNLPQLYELFPAFDFTYLKVRAALNRYAWFLALVGIAGFYEAAIGHYTLSALAIVLSAFAVLLLLGGLIFLVPNILQWTELISKYRITIADVKAKSHNDQVDSEKDKQIEGLETKLFKKETLGVAVKVLIGLFGAASGIIVSFLKS